MNAKAEQNNDAPATPEAELNKRVENILSSKSDSEDDAPGAPAVGAININEEGELKAEKPKVVTSEPDTDKAVDDIAAKESDAVLAAEDKENEDVEKAFISPKGGILERLKNAFHEIWDNPKRRWIAIISILWLIFVAFAIPQSRYFILNNVGVRSSSSLTVLDDSTKQPLKNVTVKLGTLSTQTDSDGKVKLEHIKLGSQNLVIQKRAFATVNRKLVVGWGSNPLGEFNLSPVGTQYAFLVTDFLSGKPIPKAEASVGEASAIADEKGKIVLTIDKTDAGHDLDVSVKADGQRDETVHLTPTTMGEQAVKMVPAHRLTYISKRSGKYDLYKTYADGKEESVVLAGTGRERANIVLIPHPKANVVALVSSRDNVRNKDGYLLDTLTIVDLDDNQATTVVQAEQIQLLEWAGDRLIFAEVAAGASAASQQRHKLESYDYKKDSKTDLAATNYFNDVVVVGGNVYYAPSSTGQKSVGLFKISPDGTNKQTVLTTEVWNIFRTDYDKLTLSLADSTWYDFKITEKPTKLSNQPPNQQNRVYINSPNGDKSAWVDSRDGKGVLIIYDTKAKTEKVIRSQSGLKNPVYWLRNNVLVYRVNTDQETSDYVLNLDGGEPRKAKDVTNTTGIDQWYYY